LGERILIVEDDLACARMVSDMLTEAGYEVATAHDGLGALQEVYRDPPDLAILDLMLPGMDGWKVCRRIRDLSNIPIIILTGRRDENDRVKGLDYGADDFVVKPFRIAELKARVQAVLRRYRMPPPPEEPILRLDGGNLIIDLGRREVIVRGERVSLTPTEYRLLSCLARNAGRTLSHDEIMDEVWGYNFDGVTHNLKVYIRYLRRKIEEHPGCPKYILTERGMGYRLVRT